MTEIQMNADCISVVEDQTGSEWWSLEFYFASRSVCHIPKENSKDRCFPLDFRAQDSKVAAVLAASWWPWDFESTGQVAG